MTEVTESQSAIRDAIDTIKVKAYDVIWMRQNDPNVNRRDACDLALNILIEVVKDLELKARENSQC